MLWASTYFWFWAIIEIFTFSELSDSRIISYIVTLALILFCSIFSYWFIIYPYENWCIWSRYQCINLLRKEFYILDRLKPKDYSPIIRYNLAKKISLCLTIVLQIKLKLSPYLLTFLIISIQWMYTNLIIGLSQFTSSITRGMAVFNEVIIVSVVLLISVEYLNESFDPNSSLKILSNICLNLIRIHILIIIFIELSRIFLFILSRAISFLKRKWNEARQSSH